MLDALMVYAIYGHISYILEANLRGLLIYGHISYILQANSKRSIWKKRKEIEHEVKLC